MQDRMENRVYAGFFVRMIAYLVDSLIAFVVGGIVKAPFGIAAGAGLSALRANFIFQYSVVDVMGYVGMVSYFVLITYLTHTTLGKMLFRLEVVTESGEWTFFNVLYRETVGRFLSNILCIGYLAVLVQAKHQGFHDMLCDTYVVYKDMQRIPAPAKLAVAGGAPMPAGQSMPGGVQMPVNQGVAGEPMAANQGTTPMNQGIPGKSMTTNQEIAPTNQGVTEGSMSDNQVAVPMNSGAVPANQGEAGGVVPTNQEAAPMNQGAVQTNQGETGGVPMQADRTEAPVNSAFIMPDRGRQVETAMQEERPETVDKSEN